VINRQWDPEKGEEVIVQNQLDNTEMTMSHSELPPVEVPMTINTIKFTGNKGDVDKINIKPPKKAGDINPTRKDYVQNLEKQTIKFEFKEIDDMFPVSSLIQILDGTDELDEIDRLNSLSIQDNDNYQKEIQRLKLELDDCKNKEIELQSIIIDMKESMTLTKQQTSVNDQTSKDAHQRDISKFLDRIRELQTTIRDSSNIKKEKYDQLQQEVKKLTDSNNSFSKSYNEYTEIKIKHDNLLTALSLPKRSILETVQKYGEIQLKLRLAKKTTNEVMSQRWPHLRKEWNEFMEKHGYCESLNWLVHTITNLYCK
jgi:predicted  nucleic acid-binding Zn-ribbon protein